MYSDEERSKPASLRYFVAFQRRPIGNQSQNRCSARGIGATNALAHVTQHFQLAYAFSDKR